MMSQQAQKGVGSAETSFDEEKREELSCVQGMLCA